MKKYTDIKLYNIFIFLIIKWKSILIVGILSGILISLSYYLSYNGLDSYYPNAMTEASIISKIDRTNEEINYYKKILDENKDYRENSVYFSYTKNDAFLYDIEISLPDVSQVEYNKIMLELNSNNFYKMIGMDLQLGVDSKYVKELFSFSVNNNKINMKITLSANENLELYTDAVLGYLKSNSLISENYQINQISKTSITKKDLETYYLNYFESDSIINASILDRRQELKLYEGYLRQVNEKLLVTDYVKILCFSISYMLCLICIILIILYIKKNIPLTKEDYVKEGLIFKENEKEKKDVLKLTSFKLLILLLKHKEIDKSKTIMILPGIIAKKSLISFYKNNLDLNYIYYEDDLHEE